MFDTVLLPLVSLVFRMFLCTAHKQRSRWPCFSRRVCWKANHPFCVYKYIIYIWRGKGVLNFRIMCVKFRFFRYVRHVLFLFQLTGEKLEPRTPSTSLPGKTQTSWLGIVGQDFVAKRWKVMKTMKFWGMLEWPHNNLSPEDGQGRLFHPTRNLNANGFSNSNGQVLRKKSLAAWEFI